MGRRAGIQFPLPDGRVVGASLKLRYGRYRVQFAHPTEKGKYIEAATNVTEEQGQGIALAAAARLVLKHYAPTLPPDLRKATWEDVTDHLKENTQLRDRSLDVYLSAISILRTTVDTKGPSDVDSAKAREFKKLYSRGTWSRSNAPDARQFKRSPKTVENALRRLSSLWNKYLKPAGFIGSNPWTDIERPTLPEKQPTAPSEEDIDHFLVWTRTAYKGWTLLDAFLETKMIAGCRLIDLCSARSSDLDAKKHTLTLHPDTDKTHRERVIPLPPDLSATLAGLAGPTYLWESYPKSARVYRPGRRNKNTFVPGTLYWAVLDVFERYAKANPDRPPIKSHDLRRRAITLVVKATGSVDAAAQIIGVHPTTANRHYIDAEKAFDVARKRREMIEVLRPKGTNATPELGESSGPRNGT